MYGNEWGPIAQLAACFRLDDNQAAREGFAQLLQAPRVWSDAARFPKGGFWPATLPEVAPKARPRRLRWPRFRLRRRHAIPRDSSAIVELLPDCHAWLATGNARFFAPFLTIDPRACPSWVGLTSDRSLFWCLAIFAAEQLGPEAVLAQRELAGALSGDEDIAPGDLLVFHRLVERLAGFWWDKTGAGKTGAGGLRSQLFLNALSGLPAASRNAVLAFAACSPLTRITHLELFPDPLPPNAISALPCLLRDQVEEGGGASWLWKALITNSVYGALLAAPTALPDLKRAETDLRDAEHQAAVPGQGMLERARRRRTVAKAQERLSVGRKRLVTGLEARLQSWSDLAREPALLELHLAILDRMARLAVVRAAPAMRSEWRHTRATNAAISAGEVMRSPRSAYCSALMELLLSMPADEFTGEANQDERTRIGGLLDKVLNVDSLDPAMAPHARRWQDAPYIHLPFLSSPLGDRPKAVFDTLQLAIPQILGASLRLDPLPDR